MGGGQEVETVITGLGLGYSLLTPFTSFVAIDAQVANRSGQVETVRQPLPMPEGVSNLAIGSGGQGLGGIAYSPATGAPGAFPQRSMKRAESQRAYAPASAEPSAPMSELASTARTDGKGKAGRDLAKSSDKVAQDEKAPVCSVKLIPGRSHSLGDSKALLAAIRRVAEQQGCAKAGSTLRLRITVDATGKVTKAERLAGDRVLAAAIAGKLTGQSSATTANAAPEGTLDVTIRF
ncbi:MAG TPA: hypothetical protein VJ860_00875 [Polyangia bacterium]|nr:hypothetical protein [Polyangia bacterium]